jgi:hypothetical protein
MKIHELTPIVLRESFTDISVDRLGIAELVRQADETLEDPAAYAITSFVGVEPDAKNTGAWGGIMQSRRLEDAYSNNPSAEGQKIRQQIDTAMAPVKAALSSRFGRVITLYRAQRDVGDQDRSTLSWTSDPRVAAHFAGVEPWEMKLKQITDQDIAAALEQYHRTGKVKWQGKTYVRTDEPTDDPDLDQYYYEIYDRSGDMITDGDDLAQQFREDQQYHQELLAKKSAKLAGILTATIPIDDIIWITDRAGQSEFILHNQAGKAGYVDKTGRLIKT